ncbi:MAG: hypothetical protein GY842_10185, partial [bacterium]|nr:hypothetical protein [bacterium]
MASLAQGLVLSRTADGVTIVVPPADYALGSSIESPGQVWILPIAGWERDSTYHLELTGGITDTSGRTLGVPSTLTLLVPAGFADSPILGRLIPIEYDNVKAAGLWGLGLESIFPGGQTSLFQGLWTAPVTGLNYARPRGLDARMASWLSEDPKGPVDS